MNNSGYQKIFDEQVSLELIKPVDALKSIIEQSNIFLQETLENYPNNDEIKSLIDMRNSIIGSRTEDLLANNDAQSRRLGISASLTDAGRVCADILRRRRYNIEIDDLDGVVWDDRFFDAEIARISSCFVKVDEGYSPKQAVGFIYQKCFMDGVLHTIKRDDIDLIRD